MDFDQNTRPLRETHEDAGTTRSLRAGSSSPNVATKALSSFLSWLGYGKEEQSPHETTPETSSSPSLAEKSAQPLILRQVSADELQDEMSPEREEDFTDTMSDIMRQQREEQDLIERWRDSYLLHQTQRDQRKTRFAEVTERKREAFAHMLAACRVNNEKELLQEYPPMDGRPRPEPKSSTETPVTPLPPPRQTTHDLAAAYKSGEYSNPSPELLNAHESGGQFMVSQDVLEEQKIMLQETLDNFTVDAQVWDALVGPRVTQLRIRPGRGVRVEAISALQNDIALSLSAKSLRIQAPIPGEPFVGIEVPNGNETPLYLRHMLESPAWLESRAKIPLILGMDITGETVVTDLAAAPHMLIAGATGSGKSVCMNALIMCLLQKFNPDELRMVLVDPKRVEFSVYSTIPHLVTPVVTDPKKVVSVLAWVVREMEQRYELLSHHGARNIAAFNAAAEHRGVDKLPYLVVIIDELADLMMTARGDVETALARLAQLSRAVGIHTIIATQRPSVNVITGIIKANYPTRIAFQVTSQIDSRTILDGKGAEQLRGQGDMLFSPPGIGRLMRIQGPLISDNEIERVVDYMSDQCDQTFIDSTCVTESILGNGSVSNGEEADDELLGKAIEIIMRDRRASTSYLQRCLRVGYNRAANLIEVMEARGIVGPQVGSAPREILLMSEDSE